MGVSPDIGEEFNVATSRIAQTLAARAEIADVLATFCERIDEYDWQGAADVFAEDCLVDYGAGRGGPVHGRAACAERFRKGQGEFRLTHHQLGQSRVTVDADGARASATTYITAWHEDWSGARSVVRLRYLDQFVRVGETWQIVDRHVHAAGIEGFDGVEWDWVPRARPEVAAQ
jgi:ketosteroid isomerase-like protein